MELQHVNVKIFVEDDDAVEPWRIVEIFHRWIRDRALDELLIDVADYRHVPDGPGVLLAGHDAIYSMDHAGGRWGLRYNRRTVLGGSNEDRFRQAFDAAARACALLEREPPGRDPLRFSGTDFELFVNDRALAPNTPETYAECRPELETFLQGLTEGGEFELRRQDAPGARFGVAVRLGAPFASGG